MFCIGNFYFDVSLKKSKSIKEGARLKAANKKRLLLEAHMPLKASLRYFKSTKMIINYC